MFVKVRVYVQTPDGIDKIGVEGFSRVPNIGERIESQQYVFRVIDVTHFSNRGLPADGPVAAILVQDYHDNPLY